MAEARSGTEFERRVAWSALVAAPLLVVLGAVAMVMNPEAFAESDSATGAGLWLGAAFGLAMFVAFTAVPQLLFGLGLRSGMRAALTATLIAAPLWALYFGLLPLAAALSGGGPVSPPSPFSHPPRRACSTSSCSSRRCAVAAVSPAGAPGEPCPGRAPAAHRRTTERDDGVPPLWAPSRDAEP